MLSELLIIFILNSCLQKTGYWQYLLVYFSRYFTVVFFLSRMAVTPSLEVGHKLEVVSHRPDVDFRGRFLQCEVDG